MTTAVAPVTERTLKPGDAFSMQFLTPLKEADERMINKLIDRTIERGGAASKLTTENIVRVTVYPRGED